MTRSAYLAKRLDSMSRRVSFQLPMMLGHCRSHGGLQISVQQAVVRASSLQVARVSLDPRSADRRTGARPRRRPSGRRATRGTLHRSRTRRDVYMESSHVTVARETRIANTPEGLTLELWNVAKKSAGSPQGLIFLSNYRFLRDPRRIADESTSWRDTSFAVIDTNAGRSHPVRLSERSYLTACDFAVHAGSDIHAQPDLALHVICCCL
jgi:hypothetical protein